MTTEGRKLTQPLESVTVIFGALLLAFMALVTVSTLTGSGSFLGFGHEPICASLPPYLRNQPVECRRFRDHRPPRRIGYVNGTIQACTVHPGTGQRALSTLTSLPSWLIIAG